MAYPRSQRSRAFKYFTRVAGNLILNSTTWANLPTIGTTWDVALQAQVGDLIEANISCRWNNESVYGHLDVATIVSAAPVNYFVSGGNNSNAGISAWVGHSGVYQPVGGPHPYVVVAGDVSSGLVTLRLRYRTESASNKTIISDGAGGTLMFMCKNLGPASPH